MLEILKAQYESGEALIQNKNYHLSKREAWPVFFHDLYPIGQEYYFELNPYFTFNVYRPDLLKFAKTFFIRDGKATFAAFILRHYNFIPKAKTLFLIHPELVSLLPPNYQQYFACWHIVQPKKISVQKAKRIVVSGISTEHYIGSLDKIVEKLLPLQNVDPMVEIDVYLPHRKDPFSTDSKESILGYQIIEKIKEIVGSRKINFIRTKELMETQHFKDYYLIDLAEDTFVVADNFIHYLVASRGGTVAKLSEIAPKNSVFSVALSFHHEVHITPIPEAKSKFMDLLFAKKTSSAPSVMLDPAIHVILRS